MPKSTQQIIERVGLIPVLRAKSVAQGHAVVDAMMAGGVTVVEVTMTVPGAIDLLKELKKEYGAKLLLGSGTVTTADQAQATIDAGAEFVVSPSLHPEVIAVTKANRKSPAPARSRPPKPSPHGAPARITSKSFPARPSAAQATSRLCSRRFRISSSFPRAASRFRRPKASSKPAHAPSVWVAIS